LKITVINESRMGHVKSHYVSKYRRNEKIAMLYARDMRIETGCGTGTLEDCQVKMSYNVLLIHRCATMSVLLSYFSSLK